MTQKVARGAVASLIPISLLSVSQNLDEIPCRIIVLTLVLTRLTCLLTRYTWSKKGLRRPYATSVLHTMQLTPQRKLTRWDF